MADQTSTLAFPIIRAGQIGDAEIQTVNARDLHAFLGVGKDFSTWVKDRIEQYGFAENVDFVVLPEIGENSGRGRPAKEYAITLDMAKELAMVERNEKGKQARQYFIECERRAKAPFDPAKLSRLDLIQLALAAETDLQVERGARVLLEAKVQQDAPKVAFAESVAAATDAISIGQAAQLLGTGQNRLFAFMREKGLLKRNNQPYQHTIESGLLDVKLGSWWEHPTKGLQRSITPLVTGKGLQRLRLMLDRAAVQ